MPVASFSGLASGIDTAALVKQLVQLERAPIQRIEDKQSDLNAQSKKFTALKDLLGKLQTAAKDLDSRDEFLTSSASSSDDKSVTASVSGAAELGSIDVEVTSLASAQRTYSNPIDSKSQAGLFGTGELLIQIGDQDLQIQVSHLSTLDSIAADINSRGAPLTASVLFTGGAYRLSVTAKNTGAANEITFTEEPQLLLGLSDEDNLQRPAADAVFKIDGFDATSATNTVTDVIPGLSFQLKDETASTTITVTRDETAIKAKVQAFVDAYNAVQKQLNAEFAFSGQAKIGGGSLAGDSSLRGIQSALRTLAGDKVAGLTGLFSTFSSVGVRAQGDGSLKFETDVFSKALAQDPEAVAAVFTKSDTGSTIGMAAQFSDAIDGMIDGTKAVLPQRIQSIADRVRSMDDQIDNMERRMERYEQDLQVRFAAMEQLLSQLQGQGSQLTSILSGLS